MGDVGSGFEQVAGRLRLRRPAVGDLEDYVALHTDPRTYAHAPDTMPDRLGCRVRLEGELQHWQDHGFGYLAVELATTGRAVGWGGVRSYPHHDTLNLYYRLRHDVLGQGLGGALACAVTVSATEWLPGRPVRASVAVTNPASLRTALSAGLVKVGLDQRPDRPSTAPPSHLLELPRIEAVTGDLVLMREPDGSIAGRAWRAGVRELHVVVEPGREGRNLEALLLAGLRARLRGG